VAIEERTSIRQRIMEAYKRNCLTLEDMIMVASAIEEELLYASSSTRLDYFKSAINWDSRLQIKQKQLSGAFGMMLSGASGTPTTPDEQQHDTSDSQNNRKRPRPPPPQDDDQDDDSNPSV
jgi:hypothetical protein